MFASRNAIGLCALLAVLCACSDDDSNTPAGTGPGRDAGRSDGSTADGKGVCTSDGDCETSVEVGAPQHIEGDIDYPDKPPAGGPHNPCWTTYGVHDDAARAENWVHNLEHGAVVYLYKCPDGCADDIASLSALVKARPRALLTSYEDMSHRFAIVSWGFRLETDTLDIAAFEAFYAAHEDHGLESISSGPPSGCP